MNRFMILAVVPYGCSKLIIKSANKAGATGATVIRARGTDRLSYDSFFGFKIIPEEEMILIMATKETTEAVCSKIKSDMEAYPDCKGSLYILPMSGINDLI